MSWFGVPQYLTGRVRSGPHHWYIQVMAKVCRLHIARVLIGGVVKSRETFRPAMGIFCDSGSRFALS